MSSLSNLLTVNNYAALKGTQNQAIYKLISRASLKAVVIGRITFIDKERYPPNQRFAPLQPQVQTNDEQYGQAEGITLKNLRTVRDYAKQCNTAIHIVYESIMAAIIKPVIIDGIAFINTEQFPPSRFAAKQLRRTKRG